MHRLRLTALVRLAGLLLILLIPFMGTYKGTVRTSLPERQDPAACADLAINCKPPVKYLGESRGCACFSCEYGRKAQRILCSADEAEKNKFRALLPKS